MEIAKLLSYQIQYFINMPSFLGRRIAVTGAARLVGARGASPGPGCPRRLARIEVEAVDAVVVEEAEMEGALEMDDDEEAA